MPAREAALSLDQVEALACRQNELSLPHRVPPTRRTRGLWRMARTCAPAWRRRRPASGRSRRPAAAHNFWRRRCSSRSANGFPCCHRFYTNGQPWHQALSGVPMLPCCLHAFGVSAAAGIVVVYLSGSWGSKFQSKHRRGFACRVALAPLQAPSALSTRPSHQRKLQWCALLPCVLIA